MADAAASSDAIGNWGVTRRLVYVLSRVSTAVALKEEHGASGGTHGRVGPRPGMLLRVTLAIVNVRCSVRVNGSRGSARFRRLRAHATICGGWADTDSSQAVVCLWGVVVWCCAVLCCVVLRCVGTVRGEDVAMVSSASYGVGTVRTWLRRRYGLGGWGWGRHLCTEDVSPGGGNVRQQCVVQGT